MISYEDLYEPQKQLLERVEQSWQSHSPVVIQAGQRSGKNVIATCLANRNGGILTPTICVSVNKSLSMAAFGGLVYNATYLGAFQALQLLSEMKMQNIITRDTVVIIDQCFWIAKSEELFDAYSKYTHKILAMSSKGPHRWHNRERIWRYSSTDLNPTISSELLAQIRLECDADTFERDFGNQEP